MAALIWYSCLWIQCAPGGLMGGGFYEVVGFYETVGFCEKVVDFYEKVLSILS